MTKTADLEALLSQHSLLVLGTVTAADRHLALIGPDEPKFWPHFSASVEYRDSLPDPLDRWSKRVLTDIASELGITALFPFGGPPFEPFYTWAVDSGRFFTSPINFLVHDERGLFASFRGAFVLPKATEATPTASPCSTCAKPCETACPVDAFKDGYNVAACKAYLASASGSDCMDNGCAARRACPVGQGCRLPEQAAFHMKAFL